MNEQFESAECGTEDKEELKRSNNRTCPCNWVEPCSRNCTCANPHLSGGCRRCCRYGSPTQRKNAAERLAKLIDGEKKE
jgi:hypothetical protein